jgi:flagellin
MGMGVITNVPSLSAARFLRRTDESMTRSLERLSSGLRITRAADDAAGLAIAEGLRAQVGVRQALRNAQDGINVVRTADGALEATTSLLQRMRDLAVQAANAGALDGTSTAAVQTEVAQLKELARLEVMAENMTTSMSGIRDVDVAQEIVTLSRHQIVAQAGTAMLSQADRAPRSLLDLLG